MQKKWKVLVFAAALIGATPAAAHAQTFLTPFAGASFGGDAPNSSLATGVGLTFMGKVAGFEAEVGYTPDFFNESSDVVLIGDGNVLTLSGNLVLGVGAGPVRPYGVVGVGLLRSRVEGDEFFDDVSQNDFGFNIGAGVIGMLTDHLGLRGDVRYFRSLQDPSNDDDLDLSVGNFDFWRATAGVTFRF